MRFIAIWLCFFCLFYIFNVMGLKTNINNAITEQKDYIGKTVVIKGDSLKVVDYSFINQTLTLENGVVVSQELAK